MTKTHLPSTLKFVLHNVQDNPNISATELSGLTGFSQSVVSGALRALVASGDVFTPDATAGRNSPRRYTAHTPSEVSVLRDKLAKAHELIAHQRADGADAQELEQLRAFKAEAIARYPDLAAKSVEQLVREELAQLFPEFAAAAAAGELDNSLLAKTIRAQIEERAA